MVHFPGTEYRSHTTCMTEDQKYQGALYKSKRQKSGQAENSSQPNNMAHRAYVEDVTEEWEEYRDYEIHESDEDDTKSSAELPEAPTPPSAVPEDDNLNVFDFLVDATPNASNLALQHQDALPPPTRQLVRFEHHEDAYVDPTGYMVDDDEMIQYGDGAVSHQIQYETPAPKAHRKKTKDSDVKKDKKRKRLHIDTAVEGHSDQVMTDAPPVLHSGLTGGLNRLMRPPQFPPSPDYSGGDAGDQSPVPASPIKKTKHHAKAAKPSRSETIGTGLRALMTGTSKTKVSKKRKHSSERKEKKKKRTHHRRSSGEKAPKLIEYRPQSGESTEGESGQMVLYRPRSDLFLSFCTKGPESERGCSMNKALKRFHRERDSSGDSLGKSSEEKELWRSLRLRRNDRGEIVLFSIDDDE